MPNFDVQSSDHIFRLIYVVRNAANYRSMVKYKDDFNQNYWIHIFNNFFDLAILEWCKVFGTDSEPTHWKTLVDDHESFRKGRLKHMGLTESEWESYWTKAKNYRNNIITHFRKNPNKVKNYPALDNIITSACYYYGWLVKALAERNIIQEPESLEVYYNNCLKQAELFTEKAYCSTKHFKEKVF